MGQTVLGFPAGGAGSASSATRSRSRAAPAIRCRPPTSPPRRRGRHAGRRGTDDAGSRVVLHVPAGVRAVRRITSSYGDTSVLPTPVFLYGMEPGEEIAVDIEPGKTLIIKFLAVGEPHADGTRRVFFELNGQPREVTVTDRSLINEATIAAKADPNNPKQIGAACPAWWCWSRCKAGERSAQGQKLMTLEAMKMETTIAADADGTVATVHVVPGTQVERATCW